MSPAERVSPSRLSLRHVRFAYRHHTVLHDVSLEATPGSIVGLVGPNGSGKTTLLKVAAGLLPAARGEVLYDGAPLAHLTARARAARRAYVPQGMGEAFPYRVDEVVAMGRAHESPLYAPRPAATASGASVIDVLDEIASPAGVDARFDELSGGERQLVLIARALWQNAGIYLLDEPASHLDLKHRGAVIAALKRRARAGATVLWSVHDLHLSALVCDELVVLKEGRIVASGPPAAALTAEVLTAVYETPLVLGTHATLNVPTVDLDPRVWQ